MSTEHVETTETESSLPRVLLSLSVYLSDSDGVVGTVRSGVVERSGSPPASRPSPVGGRDAGRTHENITERLPLYLSIDLISEGIAQTQGLSECPITFLQYPILDSRASHSAFCSTL